MRLNPGNVLNWQLGEGGVREVVLDTRYGGDNLINFRITLASGDYQLSGDLIHDQGNLRQTVNYHKKFKAKYDRLHLLNDIPKGIDEPILCALVADGQRASGERSDTGRGNNGHPLPEGDGRAVGALEIKGVGGMSVEAEPLYSVSISHAKTDRFASDATP